MQVTQEQTETGRYATIVEASKRIRWEIDRDVIRGRQFDYSRKFLPDSISKVNDLEFLDMDERRTLSQIQGRTYANMFGLVERFISAKMLEISHDHWSGDQTRLGALVGFTDEELKHQELFRRIERLAAERMTAGYEFLPRPNDVASVVLGKSTWAVLALTCHIELFTLAHYRSSIEPDADLSELYKDVFLHHWKEESQHAILDELEWKRVDAGLSPQERDQAVDDLIALVGAVDGLLQLQAGADSDYFIRVCGRALSPQEVTRVRAGVLKAYRWQYIVSGVEEPRFMKILGGVITSEQMNRIVKALAPIVA